MVDDLNTFDFSNYSQGKLYIPASYPFKSELKKGYIPQLDSSKLNIVIAGDGGVGKSALVAQVEKSTMLTLKYKQKNVFLLVIFSYLSSL